MSVASSSSRRRNYLLHPHRTDGLIGFIKDMLHHSFVLDTMASTTDATWCHIEELIEEHRANAGKEMRASRLSEIVPTVSRFFTPLPLREAWTMYDAKYKVSSRRCVQPSFNEVRHVLNLAQVLAMRQTQLRLVSFDGDCTLYSDGKDFSDPKLARYIALLLRRGVHVALVTAAGYAYDAPRYMRRLAGLFAYFELHQLAADAAARFWVLGGECNYLLACEAYAAEEAAGGVEGGVEAASGGPGRGPLRYRLVSKEPLWATVWSPDERASQSMLDAAEASLRATLLELRLRASILRKPRAVGMVPGGREGKERQPGGSGSSTLSRESLDEAVLRLQQELRDVCKRLNTAAEGGGPVPPPFCAFNGGNDVWADIGNKRVGVTGSSRLRVWVRFGFGFGFGLRLEFGDNGEG